MVKRASVKHSTAHHEQRHLAEVDTHNTSIRTGTSLPFGCCCSDRVAAATVVTIVCNGVVIDVAAGVDFVAVEVVVDPTDNVVAVSVVFVEGVTII